MILLLHESATPEQLEQMLQQHKFYIKTAVDIERRVLVGGGNLHYDCEQALLNDGSQQENIWAASFSVVRALITKKRSRKSLLLVLVQVQVLVSILLRVQDCPNQLHF
ncbi:DUF5674 family protein [Nostoc sp. WHI]|uniref:DUF5674 family protein n=1 Tax=Nostoc sp. WHI TaxID=2650611 RepID=UPI001E29C44E|nr:DUF5674 family protein [Nostoc sp. WHI]